MAIFTSTNNICPNSSESFYIDFPSPPLISMATSLRFQGDNTASGNPTTKKIYMTTSPPVFRLNRSQMSGVV